MDSTHLQHLLDLLQGGNDSARTSLIQHSIERCRFLTRRMFRRDSDLRKFEETDDVLSKALVRLHKALAQVKPPNVRAYVGLAACQIRRVIADLAREAAKSKMVTFVPGHSPEGNEPSDGVGEPRDLLEWAEFHERVEALPDDEREVIDLLFYQGLNQPDAAAVLHVPLRTLKRRWQKIRLSLREAMEGEAQ
jgi:RNA polymerase sigma-70 factor (ECF subfamily)